jgi:multiple sugar transport system permease protein
VLTAPFAVVFLAFLLVPLGYAFWMSLQSSSLIGGNRWVGADNYLKAMQDPLFLKGIVFVIGFTLVLVPIQMLVSLTAALVLDTLTSRFAQASRLIIFIPYAVPAVIGALMWGFLYSPDFGPLKDLFGAFGADAPNLLASGNVFGALVNIVTWQWAGYYMIIIYAALKGIDPTVYEAARSPPRSCSCWCSRSSGRCSSSPSRRSSSRCPAAPSTPRSPPTCTPIRRPSPTASSTTRSPSRSSWAPWSSSARRSS